MRYVYIPTQITQPDLLPSDVRQCHLQGSTMGTTWSVQLIGHQGISIGFLQQGLQEKLDQVNRQMSTWDSQSDLCRYNQAPPNTWQELPEECCQVLDYAIYLARQTTGAYDPAAGKLVNLWGFGPQPRPSSLPNQDHISQAMSGPGWRDLQFDRHERRLWQPGGLTLDLSSIAKGYAVDQLARFLEAQHVPSYLIEVGGELRGRGIRQDQSPWWVNVEQPDTPSTDDVSEHLVALHDLSIATSGNYRQFIDVDGRRYAHTIDSSTGYPVLNNLVSVSVLHPECMVADALATAFTVMGDQRALAYANEHNIAALFVLQTDHTFSEIRSHALLAMLDE